MIHSFNLGVFVTFLESRYLQDAEPAAISTALDDITDTLVNQVLVRVSIEF